MAEAIEVPKALYDAIMRRAVDGQITVRQFRAAYAEWVRGERRQSIWQRFKDHMNEPW